MYDQNDPDAPEPWYEDQSGVPWRPDDLPSINQDPIILLPGRKECVTFRPGLSRAVRESQPTMIGRLYGEEPPILLEVLPLR